MRPAFVSELEPQINVLVALMPKRMGTIRFGHATRQTLTP
jgi:hypothetical protein